MSAPRIRKPSVMWTSARSVGPPGTTTTRGWTVWKIEVSREGLYVILHFTQKYCIHMETTVAGEELKNLGQG